jgi:Uma2 family endonuclease
MTIADLEAMPDDGNRYEIIEGELFVSHAPGLTHQLVSDNIVYLIRNYLEHHPIGIVVSGIGLNLTEHSGVIPDVVFFTHANTKNLVCGERLTKAPELVIEILSAGSENIRRDRMAKRRLYGKHGVLEYWMIDRERQVVEVYRLQEESQEIACVLQGEENLSTPVLPGFSCSAKQIFKLPPL